VILDVAGARAGCQPGRRARMRQSELVLDQGRSMLAGRSGEWYNAADSERGANQQSEWDAVAEPRTGIVSTTSGKGDVGPPQT
jgi:hypothetical protein